MMSGKYSRLSATAAMLMLADGTAMRTVTATETLPDDAVADVLDGRMVLTRCAPPERSTVDRPRRSKDRGSRRRERGW